MELYFIRHGIAAERGTYDNDEQRPLIDKGRDKTTKVAKYLLDKGLQFSLVHTSPLVRAYQTAEILQQVGLTETISVLDSLKPGGALSSCLESIQQEQTENPNSRLALVGHQPDLGNWAEMLICGSILNQLVLKKAGVIGLELPSIGSPIARSTLFLLTSPKWMIG
ncbi:MAG: phosphohistidine phosphatase SixA [Cyanobacteria bacterium J06621_8]